MPLLRLVPLKPELLAAILCVVFAFQPLHAAFQIVAPSGVFAPNAKVELAREDLEQRTQPVVASYSAKPDGSLDITFAGEPGLYQIKANGKDDLPIAASESQTLQLSLGPDRKLRGSGSPATEILQSYEAFRKESLARHVYSVRADIKSAKASGASEEDIEQLTQKEVDAYKQHLRELNDFTLDKVGTSIALYATSLRWDGDYRGDELADLVDAFASEHPDLLVTQRMQERIDLARRVAIGGDAPPLEATTLDGRTLSLRDFRGQYVLVDFWASWCPPCRVENRHYRELVNDAKTSAFTLFSVNMDTSEAQWKRAAKQDGLTWPDVSDLKGLKSPMASAYAVTSLPRSFLVDPDGRIVAKDLRGKFLDAKLAELGLLK